MSDVDPKTDPKHVAHAAEFPPIDPTPPADKENQLESLAEIPIVMTARLGRSTLTIGDILKLGPGSTVRLDRDVREPVELIVGDKVFALGEVLVVDDKFAVRIKELARPGSGRR